MTDTDVIRPGLGRPEPVHRADTSVPLEHGREVAGAGTRTRTPAVLALPDVVLEGASHPGVPPRVREHAARCCAEPTGEAGDPESQQRQHGDRCEDEEHGPKPTGPCPPGQEASILRIYRVSTARDRASGGSGIGLAIAKALVEAHGGHIRARSGGIGAGAAFTVWLPTT